MSVLSYLSRGMFLKLLTGEDMGEIAHYFKKNESNFAEVFFFKSHNNELSEEKAKESLMKRPRTSHWGHI